MYVEQARELFGEDLKFLAMVGHQLENKAISVLARMLQPGACEVYQDPHHPEREFSTTLHALAQGLKTTLNRSQLERLLDHMIMKQFLRAEPILENGRSFIRVTLIGRARERAAENLQPSEMV